MMRAKNVADDHHFGGVVDKLDAGNPADFGAIRMSITSLP
jgi:hypothetical protein